MALVAEGRVVARKYRLERPLARGGMGEVWIARHLQLDTAVAVKFMDPSFAASSDARARFEREAKSSAQLRSPYVATVHDYGVEDDTPYIVMELLDGEDLSARLRREGRLTLTATTTIVTQVCRALRRAHEMGIVHRDLKPGNVFLARHDEEEIVKVLDFGIAKAARLTFGGEATKTGSLIGSPHYMSPEQSRSTKQVDHRSDLWSLGVIAFRALTGQLPFRGDDLIDVLVRVCTDPIPVPSHLAPHLGIKVDQFFERALARDSAARFQNAREMAEAFAALSGSRMAGSHPSIEVPIAAEAVAVLKIATAMADGLSGGEAAAEKTAVLSAGPALGVYPSMAGAGDARRAAWAPMGMLDPDSLAPAGESTKMQAGRRNAVGPILAIIGAGAVLLGSAAIAFVHFASRGPGPGLAQGVEASTRSVSPSAAGEPAASTVAFQSVPPADAIPGASPPQDGAAATASAAPAQPLALPGRESASNPRSKPPDSVSKDLPKPLPGRVDGLIRQSPGDSSPKDMPNAARAGESRPASAPRPEAPPPAKKKKPNFGI